MSNLVYVATDRNDDRAYRKQSFENSNSRMESAATNQNDDKADRYHREVRVRFRYRHLASEVVAHRSCDDRVVLIDK